MGILRTGLGRLVVLGSGGECFLYALAGRHRAGSFAGGYGQARSVQELDTVVGDCRVFAVVTRRLHSTVWGSNLGALLRGRSRAWLIYFAISAVGGRWFADLVRVACGSGVHPRVLWVAQPRIFHAYQHRDTSGVASGGVMGHSCTHSLRGGHRR